MPRHCCSAMLAARVSGVTGSSSPAFSPTVTWILVFHVSRGSKCTLQRRSSPSSVAGSVECTRVAALKSPWSYV